MRPLTVLLFPPSFRRQDCATGATCGGVVTGSWNTLYPTIAACCTAKLPSLDAAYCAGQSAPTAATSATNLWHQVGNVCKKDCTGTGDECAAFTGTGKLYADAALCCSTELSWVKTDWCLSRSDPATHGVGGTKFTHKWFVDYSSTSESWERRTCC